MTTQLRIDQVDDQLGSVVHLVAKRASAQTISRAALAARGMIQKLIGTPGSRAVRWTYLPSAATAESADLDALEALCGRPAAGRDPSPRVTRRREDR